MLDQSFSAENFKKILDLENRKGIYLEGEFYSDIADINRKVKEANEEIKGLKKMGLSKEIFLKEREKINEKKDILEAKKEEKIIAKLNDISTKVTAPEFKLKIIVDNAILSKPVYKTAYLLENILTLKQLQYNFRKLYKVKQSRRYSIISQLKNLLDDGFPKVILKTDIKEFFESIPHSNLLKKINDDNLLTHLSMRFIQQILKEFKDKSGESKGVPRGIGISSFLTELYMRDFDAKIKSLPNLIYYARYVDDIILIFMPQTDKTERFYKMEVKQILADEGLTMNENKEKTKLINLLNKNENQNYSFEYLGYKFTSGYLSRKHIPLTLTLSQRKKKRYAERLNKAFALYLKQAKGSEKQARKLFVKRIRFLMSNTRLVNNKRNVITGVYYTNSLINTIEDFIILDKFFSKAVKKHALPVPLASRIIKSNSFVTGFNPANIAKFNAAELNSIMKRWTK
ncbi:MAG: antiviral reverse transcriptase Drt3a [Ginsengibacter sp.]